MANQPNQSSGGTNQDKTAQSGPSQTPQPGQQHQGDKPQGQPQQGSGDQRPDPQDQEGHPPGATQGDNPNQQSGSSKS